MKRFRIPIRFLTAVVFLSFAIASISSCGGSGIGDLAGGGTGGTGISTGAITGFGSVVMNGAHYKTDGAVGPGFITRKVARGMDKSNAMDRDVFSVGMIVTLHHSSGDNNATEIDYEPRIEGPIGSKDPGPDPTIWVLGLPVILDNPTLFASLNPGNVVEVSGFVDNVGRIRATFVAVKHPVPMPGEEFEIKGFVSGLNTSDNTFHIGLLPDGSGTTVMVSYPPGGPVNGTYIQVVTTDNAPVGGSITASQIEKLVARTEFPDKAPVVLEGLVSTPWSGQGNDLSFAVEGKRVRWDAGTEFGGGTGNDLRQTNVKVQVQGTETGGVLSAARIVFP